MSVKNKIFTTMPSVLLVLALIFGSVAGMSAPVQKIIKPAEKTKAAASPFGGFMEGIGFGNFFQDVGVEKAGSSIGLTKKLPAASSIFPSIGGNTFAQPMVSPSQLTKEQVAVQKERGFMPASPFGSSSNQASNIVPPAVFQQSGSKEFGSFKFPQAFHNDFGAFANSFGSSRPAKPQAKEETEREESPSNRVAVEHKPRGRPEPRHRSTRNTQNKKSFFSDQELFPSSSNKEEKKTATKCTIVHKDGMDCEVCNDGEGGFSEHCSQSHNSGQDTKFTSSSKSKDKPVKQDEKKKEEEKAPSEAKNTKSAPQKQASKQSAQTKSAYKPPTFDFNFPSFGGHPRAQSRKQNIYDRNYDPFENFHTDHLDPFADGSNADPYKFEIPVFDSIDFQFGPESHRKMVEKSGLYKKQPSEENKVKSKESPKTSSSQRNAVARQNLYKKKEDKEDKEDKDSLGKLVKSFSQKKRENCVMELRDGMTCYICKDKYGKSDEECMFASKDPNNQHMMYSEASSYGNPPK